MFFLDIFVYISIIKQLFVYFINIISNYIFFIIYELFYILFTKSSYILYFDFTNFMNIQLDNYVFFHDYFYTYVYKNFGANIKYYRKL